MHDQANPAVAARQSTRTERRAYRLGSQDAYAGRRAVGMDDDGSAWLMSELGIESETTAANHAARARMCEAYADGYFDARSAMYDGLGIAEPAYPGRS